jgi:ribonuclease D
VTPQSHGIHLYKGDLPGPDLGPVVAIDTETMGLNPRRDRLCLAQLSAGDGNAHLVQFARGSYDAPRLKALMADGGCLKLFHYARFDVAVIRHYLGVVVQPVYCTKIAARLVRTYTDKYGLKDLTRELLGIELSKQQQSSDWGADQLTETARLCRFGLLHLHKLKAKLDVLRIGKCAATAEAAFSYVPHRAMLDLELGRHRCFCTLSAKV